MFIAKTPSLNDANKRCIICGVALQSLAIYGFEVKARDNISAWIGTKGTV